MDPLAGDGEEQNSDNNSIDDDADSFASEEIILPDSSENDSDNCYLPDSDHDSPLRPKSPDLLPNENEDNPPQISSQTISVRRRPVRTEPNEAESPGENQIIHQNAPLWRSRSFPNLINKTRGKLISINEDEPIDLMFEKIHEARTLVQDQEKLVDYLQDLRRSLNNMIYEAEAIQSEYRGKQEARKAMDYVLAENKIVSRPSSRTSFARLCSSQMSGSYAFSRPPSVLSHSTSILSRPGSSMSRPGSVASGRFTPVSDR